MSSGCLKVVRRVSGRHLKGDWNVSEECKQGIQIVSYQYKDGFVKLQVLGLGLGVDFTFTILKKTPSTLRENPVDFARKPHPLCKKNPYTII